MIEKQGSERRLTARMVETWHAAGKGAIPTVEAFDISQISDLWSSCLRIMVRKAMNKHSYTYEYMGEDVIKAYGNNLVGRQVTMDIRTIPGANVLYKLDEKLPNVTAPILEQGNFVNDEDQLIKYRSCILPFGDGIRITHAVIGLSWKVFSE